MSSDGTTALHEAARANHAAAVRVLLDYGADANVQLTGSLATPLHEAVRAGATDALAELAQSHHVNLDARDAAGDSALALTTRLLVELSANMVPPAQTSEAAARVRTALVRARPILVEAAARRHADESRPEASRSAWARVRDMLWPQFGGVAVLALVIVGMYTPGLWPIVAVLLAISLARATLGAAMSVLDTASAREAAAGSLWRPAADKRAHWHESQLGAVPTGAARVAARHAERRGAHLVFVWLVQAGYALTAYHLWRIAAELEHTSARRRQLLCAAAGAFADWVAYTVAVTSDPGRLALPASAREGICSFVAIQRSASEYAMGFCTTCALARPVRSKHCRHCGHCVAVFDHHCVWIGQDVGARNHRAFVAALLVYLLAAVWVVPLEADALFARMTRDTLFSWASWLDVVFGWPSLTVLFVCHLYGCGFVLYLALPQLLFMASNRTVNEAMAGARYEYMSEGNPFTFGSLCSVLDFWRGVDRTLVRYDRPGAYAALRAVSKVATYAWRRARELLVQLRRRAPVERVDTESCDEGDVGLCADADSGHARSRHPTVARARIV